MARAINRLTAVGVNKAKAPGFYADGAGLYMRIGPTGAKSWVFRYRSAGRLHDMGLGALHTVNLSEAREKAREQRKLRLDGLDPLAAKRTRQAKVLLAAASAITFNECAERYILAHRAGWRSGSRSEQQWRQSLADYVYPVLGALPVQSIDTGLVLKAIEPIWTEKTETASRVRGRIENILDWATARGYRVGENPARWRGHLENLLPRRSKVQRVEHLAALPYTEIAGFFSELRQQESVAARALEFLILTAGRVSEVVGARWEEINVAERVWAIPAPRMKGHAEHRVPLSAPAMAVVERMAAVRSSEFVFPSRRAGPCRPKAIWKLLHRMNRADVTIHGFRSTFRNWAAERTNFPAEIAEMALAHKVGSAVEQAYRRTDMFDKRRQLAEAWSRFCNNPTMLGEVVAIRASI
jgi:integrase